MCAACMVRESNGLLYFLLTFLCLCYFWYFDLDKSLLTVQAVLELGENTLVSQVLCKIYIL